MIKLSEKLCKDYIVRAYGTACKSGFHDEELSVEHMMMLVLSEISEAVEADRAGNYADYFGYEECLKETGDALHSFSSFIKGSVEEELSDVAIRLFDFCGAFDIDLLVLDEKVFDEMYDEFIKDYGDLLFCERCYVLCSILCHDNGNGVLLEDRIGSALVFLFCMAKDMGVDLERHIELKMKYNELRPKKHGKKY